jgi:hypothetical protein
MLQNSRLLKKYNKGVDFNNFVGVDADKKYSIVCNGVKKTSNAKVATPHKLEKQFNQLALVIDKKPNGFIARKKALKVKV